MKESKTLSLVSSKHKIFLYNAVKAMISVTLCFILFCFISGFEFVYSLSDDYIISFLLTEGDEYSVFLNLFLSKPLVWLYQLSPDINWFIVYQQVLSVFALFVINYIVFCLLSTKSTSYSIVVAVNIIVCTTNFFVIQWTQTSALICSAAVILLLFALFVEKRRKYRILQTIFSFILLLLGSFIRYEAFEMCAVLMLVIFVLHYVEIVYKNKISTQKFSFCIKSLSKEMFSIVLVICILFSGFSLHFFSERIKESKENYINSYNYNSARARVNDYDVAGYENNEDFYNSIGIKSSADLDLVKYHFIDEDFFDTNRLNSIADYSISQRLAGKSKLYLVIDRNVKLIRDEISKLRHFLPFRVGKLSFVVAFCVFIFFIALVVAIILFRVRKKNKLLYKKTMDILLPIILLLVWIGFFAIYKVNEINYLMVFLCVLSVFSSFLFNRYYFFKCFVLNIVCIALYCYQRCFRLGFRSNYVIVFPIIALILFWCQDGYLRKERKRKLSSIQSVLISFVVLLVAVMTGANCWFQYFIPQNCEVENENIINHIKANPSIDYVYSAMCYQVIDNSYSKFADKSPKLLPNTIWYGDWSIGTNAYEQRLKNNDTDCLFREMINNPSKLFIFVDTDSCDYIGIHEKYYNDHYATQGKTIKLVKEDQFTCLNNCWGSKTTEIHVATYKVVEQ